MTQPDAVRVLVADDHPIVRSGIVGLLVSDTSIEVVGEAGDGADAVMLAARLSPDVILMDLRMPVLDGVAATAEILAAGGAHVPRILVLTTYESDEQILAAIEAGASGYLIKASPPAEILAGVHAVAAGTSPLSPSVASALVARLRENSTSAVVEAVVPDEPSLLTSRECEVLTLVAQGLSNPEIGRVLFIGDATVKSHLLKAFSKLGVSDRTRAVTRAMELGILSPPA